MENPGNEKYHLVSQMVEIPSEKTFWLVIIPDMFKTSILDQVHGTGSDGHLGRTKTTS